MTYTMGENGLVLSRFAVSIISRLPIPCADLPQQKERMEKIKSLQLELNLIQAVGRVLKVLTRMIPPAVDRVYKLGEDVLIY